MVPLFRRHAPRGLISAPLVLRPGGGGPGRLMGAVAALLVAAVTGAAGYHLHQTQGLNVSEEATVPATAVHKLEQALEQARLQQRVSQGRSRELENQIDSLNQRLRESQEELTFFRKARDGKN